MTMERICKVLISALLVLTCIAPLTVALVLPSLDAAGSTTSCILSSEVFAPLWVTALALLVRFGHKAHVA